MLLGSKGRILCSRDLSAFDFITMFGTSEPTHCSPVVPDSERHWAKPCPLPVPSLGWQVTPQLFSRFPSLPDLLDEVAHLKQFCLVAIRAWQDDEVLEIKIRAVHTCSTLLAALRECFPPGYGEQALLGSGAATGQSGPAPCAWISCASLLCHVPQAFSALMSSSLQDQAKSNSVLQTRGSHSPTSAF